MSCRAYAPTSNNEIYKFIDLTYSSDSRTNNLYYKTLNQRKIADFLKLINLELWNNNLSKGLVTGGEVDYTEFFTKEDLVLMSDQLGRQEQLKLNSNLIRRNKDLLTRTLSGGIHQISQPVYNKDQTFSLIFRKKINGGEDIVVYEMVNNEWSVHSVITLSMV